MDGTANKFKTITGGTDADGAFVPASSTCTNVDCHSGATTPGWYYTPDTAAPVWTPNSGIAATNPNQGGVLNVTWNAATDAYPSNPVSYDLYKSTTNSAAAVFAGPPIATDLVGTSTTVTGLSDGTTYYFGVRAKDNWVTRNVTANTDISAGVAPGAATPPTPTQKVYYLTKPASATNLWGAVNTNLSLTCGTPPPTSRSVTAPLWTAVPTPAAPPAGQGSPDHGEGLRDGKHRKLHGLLRRGMELSMAEFRRFLLRAVREQHPRHRECHRERLRFPGRTQPIPL